MRMMRKEGKTIFKEDTDFTLSMSNAYGDCCFVKCLHAFMRKSFTCLSNIIIRIKRIKSIRFLDLRCRSKFI